MAGSGPLSSDTTTVDGDAVRVGAEALRVATIAAGQIGMPTADWIAMAVLSAAAEQAGVAPEAEMKAPPDEADAPADISEALARLEAKLDAALAVARGSIPARPTA